jgi:hypothetical protein
MFDAKVFGNTLSVLSGILLKYPASHQRSYDYPIVDILRLTLFGMRFHQKDRPKVQSSGLTLLRILLAHGGEEEGETGGEKDSIVAIVVSNLDIIDECMKQYSEESFLQAESCGILAYLVSSTSASLISSLTTTKVRSSIMQSGCIERVVQAQMNHRGDVRLQHYALWFHSGLLLQDLSSPGADAFGAGRPVLDTLAAGRVGPIAPTVD